MSFFKDFKSDISQAMNELMPDGNEVFEDEVSKPKKKKSMNPLSKNLNSKKNIDEELKDIDLPDLDDIAPEDMLDHIDELLDSEIYNDGKTPEILLDDDLEVNTMDMSVDDLLNQLSEKQINNITDGDYDGSTIEEQEPFLERETVENEEINASIIDEINKNEEEAFDSPTVEEDSQLSVESNEAEDYLNEQEDMNAEANSLEENDINEEAGQAKEYDLFEETDALEDADLMDASNHIEEADLKEEVIQEKEDDLVDGNDLINEDSQTDDNNSSDISAADNDNLEDNESQDFNEISDASSFDDNVMQEADSLEEAEEDDNIIAEEASDNDDNETDTDITDSSNNLKEDDNVEDKDVISINSAEENNTDSAKEKKDEKAASERSFNISDADSETTYVTKGTNIKGDIDTDGSIDIIGTVDGNVTCQGKVVVGGTVKGNITAGELYANGARIEGDVKSYGSVKVGVGSMIIGGIEGESAVIAGAVNGEIDVKGPVIVDSTAVIMGNIKSRSVQINNGAVIEGFCSQSYSDIDVKSFFA